MAIIMMYKITFIIFMLLDYNTVFAG
jgi:hypothetical protein